MFGRRRWIAAAIIAAVVVGGAVIRNQVKVYRARQARDASRRDASLQMQQRQRLFDLLQPVAVTNCRFERFGEPNDGGYLMCADLLGEVESAYSYGIGGYDKWGCDMSTKLGVTVHQYDCFNTTAPACPAGRTLFHPECVAGVARTTEGRVFDTIANHLANNGDRSKRIALKIDVEGAEWDSFLSSPSNVFEQIDQMAVEFHWTMDEHSRWEQVERYISVVSRLKQFFEVAHIHFNNASCVDGLEPFPTWAYEVLLVSKRLAKIDPSRKSGGLHPLDAPNNPAFADCQS